MYLNQSISQSISQSINQPISHPIQESTNMEPIIWTVITSDTATFQDFVEFMDNYEDRTWQEVFETIPMGFFNIFCEFAIKNRISIPKIRGFIAYLNYSHYPWGVYNNEQKDCFAIFNRELGDDWDTEEYRITPILDDIYNYTNDNIPDDAEFSNILIDVVSYVKLYLNRDHSSIDLYIRTLNAYPDYNHIWESVKSQLNSESESESESESSHFEDETQAFATGSYNS